MVVVVENDIIMLSHTILFCYPRNVMISGQLLFFDNGLHISMRKVTIVKQIISPLLSVKVNIPFKK